MSLLVVVWESLTEAFFMFWETLWALVLGFSLSGMVQAFVSRGELSRVMGDRRPVTLFRTSVLGAASSSCSYASSALAKSLFQRGADFTAVMVFMFASTNLVIELGLVLWLLIGWQFALAEYVGGAIMIVLFGLVGPRLIPAAWIDTARRRLGDNRPGGPGAGTAVEHGHQTYEEAAGSPQRRDSLRQRLRSPSGWADAAGYAIADITMLRREMVLGYLIAGFLAAAVPASVWETVFLTGHGFWTSLWNVLIGPFIAVISFVCSIGNIPLAAALWQGGISFGGTVAFIFADLITLPLVLIYRKFYGTRLAIRLMVVFWLVMAAAGLATEYLFEGAGLVPSSRRTAIVSHEISWNYTTILNIVFLGLFAGILWLQRNQQRFGGGQGHETDPVCGMQVEKANAPATATYEDETFYFCSDRCHERFVAEPVQYADAHRVESEPKSRHIKSATTGEVDPVCGMTVDHADAAATAQHCGRTFHFCSAGCRNRFEQGPAEFVDGTGRRRDAPPR